MSNDNYIIRAKNITKYFGSVVALEDVDFELKDGEILGLVGDNGAGKSTLIKILSGAELPNKGSLEVFGKPVNIRSPRDSFELGIETIYQDLALFDNLDFTQNIFTISLNIVGFTFLVSLAITTFSTDKYFKISFRTSINPGLLSFKDISISLIFNGIEKPASHIHNSSSCPILVTASEISLFNNPISFIFK